jgi:hypothetical protein
MSDYGYDYTDDENDTDGTPFEFANEAQMAREQLSPAQQEQRKADEYRAALQAIPHYVDGPGGHKVANPDYIREVDAVMAKHGRTRGWA